MMEEGLLFSELSTVRMFQRWMIRQVARGRAWVRDREGQLEVGEPARANYLCVHVSTHG